MKVTVIGDGAWGTALALNMLKNGHHVTLWGAFPDYLDSVKQRKENYKFLPGVILPETLQISSDLSEAYRRRLPRAAEPDIQGSGYASKAAAERGNFSDAFQKSSGQALRGGGRSDF